MGLQTLLKCYNSKVKVEPLFEEEVDFDTFSKSDFRAVKIKSCEEVKKSDKLLKFVLNDGSGEDRVILSGIKKYYDPSELVGKTAIAIVNLPPRKMMGEYSNGMLISGRQGTVISWKKHLIAEGYMPSSINSMLASLNHYLPHNFRKLFAHEFYSTYKDLAALADVLGHSSIETTRIYIMTTGQEYREHIEMLDLIG